MSTLLDSSRIDPRLPLRIRWRLAFKPGKRLTHPHSGSMNAVSSTYFNTDHRQIVLKEKLSNCSFSLVDDRQANMCMKYQEHCCGISYGSDEITYIQWGAHEIQKSRFYVVNELISRGPGRIQKRWSR